MCRWWWYQMNKHIQFSFPFIREKIHHDLCAVLWFLYNIKLQKSRKRNEHEQWNQSKSKSALEFQSIISVFFLIFCLFSFLFYFIFSISCHSSIRHKFGKKGHTHKDTENGILVRWWWCFCANPRFTIIIRMREGKMISAKVAIHNRHIKTVHMSFRFSFLF